MSHVRSEDDEQASPEKLVIPPITASTVPDEFAPLRVLVFDIQNTFARLFSRSISNHLTCRPETISHPYTVAATLGPDRIHLHIGNEQTRELWIKRVNSASERVANTTYEHATNKLLRDGDKLEQKGNTLFVTEYAPFVMKHDILLSALRGKDIVWSRSSNPSVIPDELLKLFTPIIFIEHPAVVMPAWLRMAKTEYGSYMIDDEEFTFWTSLRWSRILFDYLRCDPYLYQSGSARTDSAHSMRSASFESGIVATKPYIIDAVDVANNAHSTLATFCRLLDIEIAGGNSTYLSYFSRAAEAFKKAIPDTLLKIFGSNAQSTTSYRIEIDHEFCQWRKEFGDEAARLLKAKVEEDMPHYEYLKSFKVRILPNIGLPIRRQTMVNWQSEHLVSNPLHTIASAVNGQQKERHFSC